MGLDAVGILVGLEKRFDIQIDEARFTQAVSVDDIIAIVLDELNSEGREVDDTDLGLVQFRVCDVIACELGIEPMDVQSGMRLVEDLGMT